MIKSNRSKRFLVFTACTVTLLSAIGMSLPYPILAPLFADGHISPLNHFMGFPPKFLLGLALAINPLGILFGSSVLGPLSDRYDRRSILLGTILISAVGHLAVVLALLREDYLTFAMARFVTGLAEGNTSLIGAMLADELDGERRTRAFALFNGANCSGWLIGPLIAGATVQFGFSVPFEGAAVTLLFTFVLGWYAFLRKSPSRVSDGDVRTGKLHIFTLLMHRPLRQLFAIHLSRTLGVTAFYEFFPLLLVESAKFGPVGISIVSGMLCAAMIGISMIIGHGWMKPGSPERLRCYNLVTALCILLATFTNPVLAIAAIILFGVPNALYNAVFPAYCSEQFAAHGQGAIMGLITTTFYLSNVIVALVGSGITQIDSRLILIFGAMTTVWSGWRVTAWEAEMSMRRATLSHLKQTT